MLVNNNDNIEYVNINGDDTQWVESISLPMYSSQNNARKFTLVNDTFVYIKHMMADLGLKQNVDYCIIPPKMPGELTVKILFQQGHEHYASMCVMIWERYKTAKIESNL